MKCNNCGNEVQEGLNICPFCNANLTGNQVPATPSEPVLPQDQGMVVQEQNNVAPGIVNETVAVSAPQTDVAPVAQEPVEAPAASDAPVQPAVESAPAPQTEAAPVQSAVIENPVLAESTPEVVSGQKIGESAPVIPKDVVKKKKAAKVGVIVLIAVVVIALAVAAYMFEFKSANKRVEIFTNELFSFTTKVKNTKIDRSSGKYTINGKLTAKDKTYSVDLDGTYGVDLKNKVIDYTFNIKSLNIEEELLPSPLNLELYVNNNKMYVLLQNFLDKYIYTEVEGLDEAFDSLSKNDIDYILIMNAIKNASKSALNSAELKQSVGSVTVNDESKTANIVRLDFTASNQKKMNKAFFTSLSNNTKFVEELAKLTGEKEDDIKEQLAKIPEDANIEEQPNTYLELYTPIVGSSLVGVKFVQDNSSNHISLELYPVDNGYGLNVVQDGKDVFKGTYTSTVKKTTNTEENTITLSGTIFSDDESYNFDVTVGVIDDVNPKVEKVNVKNSVDVKNLSEEDAQELITNISEYGNLGMLLNQYIESLGSLGSTGSEFGYSGIGEPIDNCSPGMNCIE